MLSILFPDDLKKLMKNKKISHITSNYFKRFQINSGINEYHLYRKIIKFLIYYQIDKNFNFFIKMYTFTYAFIYDEYEIIS